MRLSRADAAFCRAVLPGVSRTFALGIRLLPGALGQTVRCAYLLCRTADCIEDEPSWSADVKAERLAELARAFDEPAAAERLAHDAASMTGSPAEVRLVRNLPRVLAVYRSLRPGTAVHVKRWVTEMITGMRRFVLAYPNGIRIQSMEEYREYCYYVAGTVGYLLTDLWRDHTPWLSADRYTRLRDRARAFAEALQTVNILKDVAKDAEHENSIYIPEQLLRAHGSSHARLLDADAAAGTRAALSALVELAWSDLEQATGYLLTLPRRAVSIRLFCALPLLFAYATLRDFTNAPPALMPRLEIKISRREVKSLMALAVAAVPSNRVLKRLVKRTRARPVQLGWVRASAG
jgi:farnesyl-diphosphate farnesyltransferase